MNPNQNLEIGNDRLNAVEAAALIGVSVSFIRTQTQKGLLAYTKLGCRYFYEAKDVLNLIQKVEPHANEPVIE